MRTEELYLSLLTERQHQEVFERIKEVSARCEAASWVVYGDRRYVGGFETEKRRLIYRAAMRSMGMKVKRSGLCLDLLDKAEAAAAEVEFHEAA